MLGPAAVCPDCQCRYTLGLRPHDCMLELQEAVARYEAALVCITTPYFGKHDELALKEGIADAALNEVGELIYEDRKKILHSDAGLALVPKDL